MSSEPPVIDPTCLAPVFADSVTAITVGQVTHLLFSVLQPDSVDGMIRLAQVKIIVPTDQLHLMARAMLSGNLAIPATDADGKPAKVH